jgi:predicted glycosyltransferase
MWFIYALGGGWGHLTRAAALARAASPRHAVRILTNSPYAGVVRKALPELDVAALDPALPAPETRRAALREIRAARPSCLIVDTFPRGLGGELVPVLESLDAKKVLVHRDQSEIHSIEATSRVRRCGL